MKKLLSMLGAIGLVATSSATVVSCGDKDEVKVLDLATATNEISMVGLNGKAPAGDAILKAFNSTNNTELKDIDVTIGAATPVEATGDAAGTKFTSTITAKDDSKLVKKDSTATLTITLTKTDLSKLTVKDLTITNATNDLTTPATIDEIFAALKAANKDIMFAVTDLAALPTPAPEIKAGKYSVEISAAADNKDVTGKVTLNIILSTETPAPETVALSDLIKTLGLGQIDDVKPETILTAILGANKDAKDKGLSLTDVSIVPNAKDATAVNAVVTGLAASTIVKEGSTVTVTFTVAAAPELN